jgi:uncharacterized RDD family membrane protein YckC
MYPPGMYPPGMYPPGGSLAAYAPTGPGPGLVWGGVWTRLGALCIDLVLIVGSLFVVAILIAAFGAGTSAGSGASSGTSSTGTAIGLIWWLLALMYHPACWYVFGASIGQKVLGLRIAAASDGQPLGLGAVLVRFAVFAMVTLLVPLAIVSAIMLANDPFKRAWHDQVARSVVVKNA